jgi:hypothetical protein
MLTGDGIWRRSELEFCLVGSVSEGDAGKYAGASASLTTVATIEIQEREVL